MIQRTWHYNLFWLVFVVGCAKVPTTQADNAPRVATLQMCIDAAKKEPWGTSLKNIPATVIDTGVLRHVPYNSYRAEDHELNVYGDPEKPCCIEIGLYNKLIESDAAKQACVEFMRGLLSSPDDRLILSTRSLAQDVTRREGLTFEITPPTAEDAYGGWWISVYDEKVLDRSRATPQEIAAVTESRIEILKNQGNETIAGDNEKSISQLPVMENTGIPPPSQPSWTASELKYARPVPAPGSAGTGGRVYVRGYVRKDGTYVNPHTRTQPRR